MPLVPLPLAIIPLKILFSVLIQCMGLPKLPVNYSVTITIRDSAWIHEAFVGQVSFLPRPYPGEEQQITLWKSFMKLSNSENILAF